MIQTCFQQYCIKLRIFCRVVFLRVQYHSSEMNTLKILDTREALTIEIFITVYLAFEATET